METELDAPVDSGEDGASTRACPAETAPPGEEPMTRSLLPIRSALALVGISVSALLLAGSVPDDSGGATAKDRALSPAAQDSGDEPEKPAHPLAAMAKNHHEAILRSSRLERERKDLQGRIAFFPDALEWQLLTLWLESLEAGEAEATWQSKLADARKTWKKAAGRPGFELELIPTAVVAGSRSETRTVHLFPSDPKKFLQLKWEKKGMRWEPLHAPEGLDRARIRVARHRTVQGGRNVPLIKELEPKGTRLVLEQKKAIWRGVLPKSLVGRSSKRGGKFTAQLPAFERFRGVSPEPNLLDMNAVESHFEASAKLEWSRQWPPPWPPMPPKLRALLLGTVEDGSS